MAGKPQCNGRIWDGFHRCQCSRTGSLEHNGLMFCKIHHPPTKEAKDKAKQEAWEQEWQAKRLIREQRDIDRAEIERKAAAYDGLIQQLAQAKADARREAFRDAVEIVKTLMPIRYDIFEALSRKAEKQ